MRENIKAAFDQICAEESLKDRTEALIAKKVARQSVAWYRPAMAMAVCFVLLAGGYWLYFVPTVHISIDINPSIELAVNRFDKVLSANGYNADGTILADTLNVRFLDVSEGVEQILQSEQIATLLADDATMSIAVVGQEQVQCDRILQQTRQQTQYRENTYCYAASPDEVEDARKCGMSYGKYRAYLELQELDPQTKAEDVLDMTMDEIREKICQHTDTDAEALADDTNGHHGNGNGQSGNGNGQSGNGNGQSGSGNGNGQNGNGNGQKKRKQNHGK